MIGIYRIINTLNNKCYIGKSSNIEKRIKRYFESLSKNKYTNSLGINSEFQNSYNKHGQDIFIYEVIEECCIELLNEKEKYWISFYNSYKNGYNQTCGGDGGNTLINKTEEEKRQIYASRIESLKGRVKVNNGEIEKNVHKSEVEQYILNGWIIGSSPQNIKKRSENNPGFKGHKKSIEHNEKLRQRFKGIPLSEEHCKKLSDSHTGYIMPQEQKDNIGKSNLGKHHITEEHRKILSNGRAGKIIINNGVINKSIFPSEIDEYIKTGYIRGRIITDEARYNMSNSRKVLYFLRNIEIIYQKHEKVNHYLKNIEES